MDIKDQYQTTDLYEAAALYASSRKLVSVLLNDNKYSFFFEDFTKCSEISNSYWNRTLMVSAMAYRDAIKTLKDRIFARRG